MGIVRLPSLDGYWKIHFPVIHPLPTGSHAKNFVNYHNISILLITSHSPHKALHSASYVIGSWYVLYIPHIYILYLSQRGDYKTVQKGKVTASFWQDRKDVTVMSTTT